MNDLYDTYKNAHELIPIDEEKSFFSRIEDLRSQLERCYEEVESLKDQLKEQKGKT